MCFEYRTRIIHIQSGGYFIIYSDQAKLDIEVMDQKEITFLKGLCLTMCPHEEIKLRLKTNLGHKLEKRVINGVRTKFADPQLMVKEFSRSSAGHIIKASSVRPVPVLEKTVKYLFTVVCSFEDVSWQEIYYFVSNRLRAVYQDIVVQGSGGEAIIPIFSSAARFYVYSHYRLCESDGSNFDPYLNFKQLSEVLLTLLPMIRARLFTSHSKMDVLTHEINILSIGNSHTSQNNYIRKDKISMLERQLLDKGDSENQSCSIDNDIKKSHNFIKFSLLEEIISLHLLMNIDKPEVVLEILELPKGVRIGALNNVIKAVISYFCGNHLPLVRLASSLPPILAVSLALQLNSIQRFVMGSWSVAYNSPNLYFKIEDIKKLLLFPSEQSVLRTCHHYGISTSEAGIKFIKGSFNWSASLLPPEKCEWVEEKVNIFPITQILMGRIP